MTCENQEMFPGLVLFASNHSCVNFGDIYLIVFNWNDKFPTYFVCQEALYHPAVAFIYCLPVNICNFSLIALPNRTYKPVAEFGVTHV